MRSTEKSPSPFVPRSTTKARCPSRPSFVSTLAQTTIQSARLALAAKDLSPSRIQWSPCFRAVARICESGHVLTLEYRDQVITEVTTSRHRTLPERKRVLDYRLRGNRDHTFAFDHGVKYHASFQLERLNRDVFASLHDELLSDCNRVKLAHCFPSENRLSPGPLGLLQTDVSADSLLIHSFHTFPENSAVVKTQSLFEFQEINPTRVC